MLRLIDKDTKCFRVKFADLLSHSDHSNTGMCFGPFRHTFTLHSTMQNVVVYSVDVFQCRAQSKQTLLILHAAFNTLNLYNIAEAKNLSLI